MKRYRFLIIGYSVRHKATSRGVNVYCTDPQVIEWLFQEVQEALEADEPEFEPSPLYGSSSIVTPAMRHERMDIQGNLNFVQFHSLRGKDFEIANWLFRRACEEGWRPLDASTPEVELLHKFDTFTFKLMKEEQS